METHAPPPPVPMAYPPPQLTSGLAVASLICGILGFLTVGLTGLPAVILGHLGLSKIKQSGGTLGGGGMAIAGLVTGYVSMILIGLGVLAGVMLPVVLQARTKAVHVKCLTQMKQLDAALKDFEIQYGTYPGDVAATRDVRFATLTGAKCLKQLEVAGMVEDLDTLLVADDRQGQWLYFPDVHATGTRAAAPILISPPIKDKIAVLRVDGGVDFKPLSTRSEIIGSSTSPPVCIPVPKRKH